MGGGSVGIKRGFSDNVREAAHGESECAATPGWQAVGYSAVEYPKTGQLVLNNLGLAPHLEPASLLSSVTCVDSLLLSVTRWLVYARNLFSSVYLFSFV